MCDGSNSDFPTRNKPSGPHVRLVKLAAIHISSRFVHVSSFDRFSLLLDGKLIL
jgi:hypothetical protein